MKHEISRFMQQHIQRRLIKQMRERKRYVFHTTHTSRICNILQKPLQKFSHSSKTSYVPKYSHKEQKTYLSPSNRQFNMFFFPHHSPLTSFFQRTQSFQQQTSNVNYGIPIYLCPQITTFVNYFIISQFQ